jgi:MinD-like ATPase involved in chromosome partitioning or flagellar assembly
MTKFIGIISAKGGVGKTTTTINLTSALDFFKRSAIALDANFSNPDLGIHLGFPRAEKNLHSALKGKHSIRESIYRHPSGIRIIPGDISYREGKEAEMGNLMDVIYKLAGTAEAVLIDSTPGFGQDVRSVIRVSDSLIIITTPDLVSATGSLKLVKLAGELGKHVMGVVVNRHTGEDYEMSIENIAEFIGRPVIGIIPEDREISSTLRHNNPSLVSDPNSAASTSYKKLAGILIGRRYVDQVEEKEKGSAFADIMERLGF